MAPFYAFCSIRFSSARWKTREATGIKGSGQGGLGVAVGSHAGLTRQKNKAGETRNR